MIGFFLIGPSSPAKTGQEDTDQSDLYRSEHQPICLSQEKQAYRVINPGFIDHPHCSGQNGGEGLAVRFLHA